VCAENNLAFAGADGALGTVLAKAAFATAAKATLLVAGVMVSGTGAFQYSHAQD
jgi:hypothetical protein